MALTDINPVVDPPKKGKGFLGTVLGGGLGMLAGAALAPVTGGASLAATAGGALAGMGAGSQIGGIIGEAASPSKDGSVSPTISQSETKRAKMTTMSQSPEVQLATVVNAKKQVPASTLPPQTADEYMKVLSEAEKRLKGRLGV